MSAAEDEAQQRLRAAVHASVDLLCRRATEEHRRAFSLQAVAAITETTFRQCEVFARDLEAFARHAKRSSVNTEDVKLVARRSTPLSIYIHNKSEELNQEQQEVKRRKKSKDTEESRE